MSWPNANRFTTEFRTQLVRIVREIGKPGEALPHTRSRHDVLQSYGTNHLGGLRLSLPQILSIDCSSSEPLRQDLHELGDHAHLSLVP